MTVVSIILVILAVFPLIKLHYGKQLFFSKDPGYYDSPFYLSIVGGGKNTIHYTLDGSEPTISDPVFDRQNPLYIEDATNHPNVYSARTDTSTGFLPSITQFIDAIPYVVPEYNVDKCNIIRASLFGSDGNCLDSITGTYYVGFQNRNAYSEIYTASIVTTPKNLFDENTGIYVIGSALNHFLENGFYLEDRYTISHELGWTGNYFNRGSEWEREAHITLFDNHQNTVLAQKCGIRIKGNSTRVLLPKSINCYARKVYSGDTDFNSDIFETGIFPHKITLFAGGNDVVFKLKDYLVNTMSQNLSFATMDFIPCAAFLNGEYWGMYYITEDYNADYIHDHYQVDSNNIIMIKTKALVEGNSSDYQNYEKMLSFISEQDMSDTANYNQACKLIDIDSFIDYYATQIYIARYIDWPTSNFALWRTRENDGSLYGDTRWRWMLFDVNSPALDIDLLSYDTLSYVLKEDPAFASLFQNESFRRKFAERLIYIGKEVFAPEKCNQFIDQYAQTLKEPLAASNKRFYMDEKSDEFEQYVADMRMFFNERYDVVWDFLAENMGEEWLTQNGILR